MFKYLLLLALLALTCKAQPEEYSASAFIHSTSKPWYDVQGWAYLQENYNGTDETIVAVMVDGLPPSTFLQVSIFEYANTFDLDNGGESLGDIFSPNNACAGNLGTIETDEQGYVYAELMSDTIAFNGMYSVLGRGIAITYSWMGECVTGDRLAMGVIASNGSYDFDGNVEGHTTYVANILGTDSNFNESATGIAVLYYNQTEALDYFWAVSFLEVNDYYSYYYTQQEHVAFHMHESGDLTDTDSGTTTLGHYDPFDQLHYLRDYSNDTDPMEPPYDMTEGHQGDFGNAMRFSSGPGSGGYNSSYYYFYEKVPLFTEGGSTDQEAYSQSWSRIVGRGITFHMYPDDGSQPTGGAGSRIAYGTVGILNIEGEDVTGAYGLDHLLELLELMRYPVNDGSSTGMGPTSGTSSGMGPTTASTGSGSTGMGPTSGTSSQSSSSSDSESSSSSSQSSTGPDIDGATALSTILSAIVAIFATFLLL